MQKCSWEACSWPKKEGPFSTGATVCIACGLYIKRANGHLMIEHDGNNIRFNSELFYPEERIAVIVLANLNGTVTGEIAKALAAVARGGTPPIPSLHKEITLSNGILARYLGTYHLPHYSLTIVPEDKHLLVDVPTA